MKKRRYSRDGIIRDKMSNKELAHALKAAVGTEPLMFDHKIKDVIKRVEKLEEQVRIIWLK